MFCLETGVLTSRSCLQGPDHQTSGQRAGPARLRFPRPLVHRVARDLRRPTSRAPHPSGACELRDGSMSGAPARVRTRLLVVSDVAAANSRTCTSTAIGRVFGSATAAVVLSAPSTHTARMTPHAPPCGGEDDALGDHLPHQPQPAGAERGTDGQFAAARRSARQEQVREVDARDQTGPSRPRRTPPRAPSFAPPTRSVCSGSRYKPNPLSFLQTRANCADRFRVTRVEVR